MLAFSTETRTQIVREMPFADYVALPGLNQSLMKTHDAEYEDTRGNPGCPALYRYHCLSPDTSDSLARLHGRAFHTLLLEPDTFRERYRFLNDETKAQIFAQAREQAIEDGRRPGLVKYGTYEEWSAKTSGKGLKGTAAYQAWMAGDSRELLDARFVSSLEWMMEAIQANDEVAPELEGASLKNCEITVLAPFTFRRGPNEGKTMQRKARLDLINGDEDIIDAKTCRTTNFRKFASASVRYGYDLQAAYYFDTYKAAGGKPRRFGFLAVEKTAPYLNCIHWMPEEWMNYARLRYQRIMSDIADNIRRNRWPNPPSGMLEPPDYLKKEIELIG